MTWQTIKDSWTGPAGFTIIVGFIIWLIQLNYAVLELQHQNGQLMAYMQESRVTDARQNKELARATVILDLLEKRVTIAEQRVDRQWERAQ